MKIFDEAEGLNKVSRRGFMKAAVAAGAAAGLYGCGKDDTTEYYQGGASSLEPDPTPPKIMEEVVCGVWPHNCGGTCLSKAYVRGGVIKRITTDEAPEKCYVAPKHSPEYGDFVQNRNCPRCRSTKSLVYGANRLMYPMIQTKKRGDMSGFRRVTWEQAGQFLKSKVDYVRKKWGNYCLLGSSSGNWGSDDIQQVNLFYGAGGAAHSTRHNYSRPGFLLLCETVGTRDGSPPPGDDWEHIIRNSDEMILWGVNYAENGQTEQAGFYLKQMRELGKYITMLETRVNMTSITIPDKYLTVLAGTDGAIAQAVMYCLLKEYRDDLYKIWGVAPGTKQERDRDLRRAIGRCIYGFFDTNPEDDSPVAGGTFLYPGAMEGTNDSYRYGPDADPSVPGNKSTQYNNLGNPAKAQLFRDKCRVPAGASLSAYVLGGGETDGCNLGPSIYPDDIGYNCSTPEQFPNTTADNPDSPKSDRLYGARVPCFGQVPKTPEWAERISGVPADEIRLIAKKLVTKNVNITFGGGLQRNSESDYSLWSCMIMAYVARCFGESGRNYGVATTKNMINQPNTSNQGEVGPGKGTGGFQWNTNEFVAAANVASLQAEIPANMKHNGSMSSGGYITLQEGYLNSGATGLAANINSRKGDYHGSTFPSSDSYQWSVTYPTSRFRGYGDITSGHAAILSSNGSVCIVNLMDNIDASLSTNTIPDPSPFYNSSGVLVDRGSVRGSRWFNTQVQGTVAPVRAMYAGWNGQFINQAPDANHSVRVYTSTDSSLVNNDIALPGTDIKLNPYGYKIGLIWGHEYAMAGNCRWWDMVLPGAVGFERFQESTGSMNRNDHNKMIFGHKAINPPGEAMAEIAMMGVLAKAWGLENEYYKTNIGGQTVSFKGKGRDIFEQASDFEYKIWNSRFTQADLQTPRTQLIQPGSVNAPNGLTTMKAWGQVGTYKNYTDTMTQQKSRPAMDSEFYAEPHKVPKTTASGRIDAFSVGMMEMYESRFFPNIDKSGRLPGNAKLYTMLSERADAANPSENVMNYKRLVYPIPLFVPIIEGLHACDNAEESYYKYNGLDLRHPNPMKFNTAYGPDGEYDTEDGTIKHGKYGWINQVSSWHPNIRAHSSFAPVPALHELKYWKRNSKGERSHLNRKITNAGFDGKTAGVDNHNLTDNDQSSPTVWQNDLYEVAWINPGTKYANGSDIQEGDVVVVESLRGKMLVSAHLSQRVPTRLVALAQGAWYDPYITVNHGNVDRGGCINTLITTRGSRINQSNAMACDCRVRLEKFKPHPDDEK